MTPRGRPELNPWTTATHVSLTWLPVAADEVRADSEADRLYAAWRAALAKNS